MSDKKNKTVSLLYPGTPNKQLRPLYTSPAPSEPSSVCHVCQTGTLLIANFATGNVKVGGRMEFSLVALSRHAQEWDKQNELQVTVEMGYGCTGSTLCEMDDYRVVFGVHWSNRLLILRLTQVHKLLLLKELQTKEPYDSISVSCAMANERTLVAQTVPFRGKETLLLYQLVEGRLEHLSQLELGSWPSFVLWSGEHLLLAEAMLRGGEERQMRIVELDTSHTPLARASELLSRETTVWVQTWCADGERVCVWDDNSRSVLVYSVY